MVNRRYMLKFYNDQTHEWEPDTDVKFSLDMVVNTLRNRLEDDIRNKWDYKYMIAPSEVSDDA